MELMIPGSGEVSVSKTQPGWGAVCESYEWHVMFWGSSKVSAALNQEVLEHFTLPSAYKLYPDADFIFKALAHTAKSKNTWFNNRGDALVYH